MWSIGDREKGPSCQRRSRRPRVTSSPWVHSLPGSAGASRASVSDDIELFVKLPRWLEIDTPVGLYNADWTIFRQDGGPLYLVRETKGTRDFLKLRTSEADKVRCGQKHFEALGVPFEVMVSADEV